MWPPLPVWRRLDMTVAALAIYTALICLIDQFIYKIDTPDYGAAAAGLNALILGLLLGFRNTQSYDRWWEGRKLWGQLVNDFRNLALKVSAISTLTKQNHLELYEILSAFPKYLREHLVATSPLPRHYPLETAKKLFELIDRWRKNRLITEYDSLLLDPHARALMDVCGACERIKTTPLPLSYRSLLRHGLVMILLAMPWFLVEKNGWWSVLAIVLMAYFLLGVEITADSIENPFEGGDLDDLPLDRYCQTIETSLTKVLQEEKA
jgi:ion channel-forming bestrophin family protein